MRLSDYLDQIQAQGRYCFLRRQVLDSLKISAVAFTLAANNLVKKGKLKRIRGDFYVIVPPEYRSVGVLPVTWFIDSLMSYLEQNYYVGLLSAASLHEAAHQQPMIFQVITNKVTRPIKVGKLYIHFYYKKTISSSFYTGLKTATGLMNVSTPEITAYDLVRYMKVSGQLNNIATVLIELAPKINPHRLAEYVEEGNVELSVAQRLGYLLETVANEFEIEPLYKTIKHKKTKPRLLTPSIKKLIIMHNRKWNVLVNELVEPDEL